jgi:hypothetical protein
MKIEITHYSNKSSYEFDHEDVDIEDLLYHLENLIRLTGYSINGTLEILNNKNNERRKTNTETIRLY